MMLLDTDILIECLRGSAAAQTWIEAATEREFYVPGIVAMELVWDAVTNKSYKSSKNSLTTSILYGQQRLILFTLISFFLPTIWP